MRMERKVLIQVILQPSMSNEQKGKLRIEQRKCFINAYLGKMIANLRIAKRSHA